MNSEHVFYDFEGEDQAMPPAISCPSGDTRTASSPAALKFKI